MKPRSLMFTLFGDFIQYYGGEIWIGSLIRLMNDFGISESSVRGATLRMMQQNFFQVRKIGNKSYYSLTPKGKRNQEEGVRRVYTIKNHKWDGFWRVLIYSMPEEMRDLRNQVRKELSWLGFGMVSGSTWLSPNPLEKQVMNMLENYNLKGYAMLFTSSSILSHEPHEIIARGWNLERIQQQYSQFIANLRPKFEVLREKAWNNELSDQEAFIERTKLVHEYRKFLFDDPGFPQDLLPDNWNGNEARDLFWHTHQLLASQSVRYFESIFEAAPDRKVEARRLSAINPFTEWNA